MAIANTIAPVRKPRRQALPGEVNITKDAEARAALDLFREQKAREADGAKAKRERTASGGTESILRDRLGSEGSVLVVNGQPVAKVSSERHTVKVDMELLAATYPEAYAACVAKVPYTFIQ